MKFLLPETFGITIRSTKLHQKDSLYYLPGDIAGITGIEHTKTIAW